MRQLKHQNEIGARATSRSDRLYAGKDPFVRQGTRVVILFPDQSERSSKNKWYERIERNPIFLLRLSLATVFLWFGLLKLADVSPVVGLLRSSIPMLANTPFLQSLGFVEICIALGLSINRLSKPTVFLMILHLLATLSVVVLSPQLIFAPRFPILTMAGEFLVKNLVLIAGGIVIMFSREARPTRRMAFTE
jgi:putative oxidoreductase